MDIQKKSVFEEYRLADFTYDEVEVEPSELLSNGEDFYTHYYDNKCKKEIISFVRNWFASNQISTPKKVVFDMDLQGIVWIQFENEIHKNSLLIVDLISQIEKRFSFFDIILNDELILIEENLEKRDVYLLSFENTVNKIFFNKKEARYPIERC